MGGALKLAEGLALETPRCPWEELRGRLEKLAKGCPWGTPGEALEFVKKLASEALGCFKACFEGLLQK